MAEWISVKDRLPEDDTWVLVYIKGRFSGTMESDWFKNGDFVYFGGVATHWMPLPEPPKMG